MAALNATPILDGGDGINRGLRGWWPLTEAGGNVARDISPYRNIAAQYGVSTTTIRTGHVGKYRSWASTGGYPYLLAPNFSWPSSSAVTVSFWVNASSSRGGVLFSFPGTGDFKAYVVYGNDVYWDYGNEGDGRINTSFAAYFDKWSLVTLVNNGVNFKGIYFNGVLATSGTTVAAPPSGITDFVLGAWNFGGSPFAGDTQNFRVWNRALAPAEIKRLYREPWAGTLQGNLRARKTFYTSGGTTYNDTIADAVTGAESFSTTLVAVGAIADATTAAESNATTQTMPNTLADAVTAAEASAASQVMPAPITDDVTGGEAFGTTAVFNSALSDDATASDSVEGSVSITYNEVIADDVTASDTMEGELPNTGDTHDGFKRRTRRQKTLDAAERKRRDDMATEARALRLSLEAAMGMAAEAAEAAPPQAAEALQEATEAARVVPAVLARQVDWVGLQAARDAVAALHTAIEAAARAKALADDDEDVEILLRAL